MILGPIYLSLVLTAPKLIPMAFGAQWVPAVQVFQFLCLSAVARAVALPANAVLYALGKPLVSAKIALVRLAFYGISVALALYYKWEIGSIAALLATNESIVCLAYLYASLHVSELRLSRYLREMMPAFLLQCATGLILTVVWSTCQNLKPFEAMALFGTALLGTGVLYLYACVRILGYNLSDFRGKSLKSLIAGVA